MAASVGLAAERLYFNIERVGNASAASIPIAIRDAVLEGVIDHPMRIFAPGFGAGAVGGFAVLRIDPAIVALERQPAPVRPDAVFAPTAPTSSEEVRKAVMTRVTSMPMSIPGNLTASLPYHRSIREPESQSGCICSR